MDSCALLYRDISRTISKGYVGPEAKRQIAEIFENEAFNSEEKARKVFERVVNERIRLLTPPVAAEIRKLLEQNVQRTYYSEGKHFFGKFYRNKEEGNNSGQDMVKLVIPQNFRGTIIEYALLTHELEHGIQEAIVRDQLSPGFNLQDFLKSLWDLEYHRFHHEVGAMLSEFEYLQSIPQETRHSLIEEIRSSPLLEENSKRMRLRWMELNATKPGTHVRSEHLAGRYSKEQIREIVTGSRLMGAGMATIPLIPLWTYCQSLHQRNAATKETSLFYQYVCRKIPGI